LLIKVMTDTSRTGFMSYSMQFSPVEIELRQLMVTLLAVGAHVATVFVAMMLLGKIRPMLKWLFICIGWMLFWMVPLIMELVRAGMEARVTGGHEHFGVLGTLSPLGLMISTWNVGKDAPSPAVGLMVQWLAAATLWVIYMVRLPRPEAKKG